MVQTIRIEAESRGRAGKGAARATRREGLVPAVIYGAKQEATLIALDPRDVMKELNKGGWQGHLYEVAVKGGGTERTLMRDVQFHPVTDRPIHVDFQRLAAGQKIKVKVAVSFLNEASSPGLKAGGVLNLVRRDVEVYADPDAVPDGFEIDLGEAGIGDSLRWSVVKDSFGTRPVIDRDFVVATIAAPTVVEEAPAAAAPAAPEATKQKAPAGKGGAAPAAKAPAKKK
jgi:large subunit ribosomal protein L25